MIFDVDDVKQAIRALEHADAHGELSEVAVFNLPVYRQALRAVELEAELNELKATHDRIKKQSHRRLIAMCRPEAANV